MTMTLAELRRDRHLTQLEVTRRVGCSLTAWQNWESGITRPLRVWRGRMAVVLGVSIGEIDAIVGSNGHTP